MGSPNVEGGMKEPNRSQSSALLYPRRRFLWKHPSRLGSLGRTHDCADAANAFSLPDEREPLSFLVVTHANLEAFRNDTIPHSGLFVFGKRSLSWRGTDHRDIVASSWGPFLATGCINTRVSRSPVRCMRLHRLCAQHWSSALQRSAHSSRVV
jgi:hypothetical protein